MKFYEHEFSKLTILDLGILEKRPYKIIFKIKDKYGESEITLSETGDSYYWACDTSKIKDK